MKERRIIPVESEYQANQLKTLESALYFAKVIEDRMRDPYDNRVFMRDKEGGIIVYVADKELLGISKGIARGAYNEAVYPVRTDEYGNNITSMNKDIQQICIDIAKKVKEGI